MTYSLYDYQQSIVEWMYNIEELVDEGGNIDLHGGILVLEMGLGKTLITLALSTLRKRKTLIVMSKTLMGNWASEIEKFKFNNEHKILLFHKDYDKMIEIITMEEIKEYDIVITTYDMVNASAKMNPQYVESILQRGTRVERAKQAHSSGIHKDKIVAFDNRDFEVIEDGCGIELLHKIMWDRVICDESQKFANSKTKLFKSVLGLYGNYKWCLTGTPIRNSYKDMWAQLKFCKYNGRHPRLFTPKNYNNIQNVYKLGLDDVQRKLPERHDHIIYLPIEGDHLEIYSAYQLQLIEDIRKFEMRECGFHCILESFLRLMQICVTPSILALDDGPSGNSIFLTAKLNKILEIVERASVKNEKVIIFSMYTSILDIISDIVGESIMITGKISAHGAAEKC